MLTRPRYGDTARWCLLGASAIAISLAKQGTAHAESAFRADGFRLSAATPEAALALQVARVPGNPDQVNLQWSSGTSPYAVYRSYTLPIGGSEFLQAGSATSLTLTMPTETPGDIAYFRISDATSGLPHATVAVPANGSSVTSQSVTVTGTVSGPVTRVWINKTGAILAGSNFTATNVPLVLGQNTIYATALALDGNVSVTTSQVTRNASNAPSAIQINSPATGTQVADVTPFFDVSITDAGSFDIGTFTAYLDGVNMTAVGSFTKNPASGSVTSGTATFQLPSNAALKPGTHTFQVTVEDDAGFINTAISSFRVTGPVISFLSTNGILLIYGNGFGTAANTTVFFTGASSTSFSSITSTRIDLNVPAAATDGPLHVEVDGIASEPVYFDRNFPGVVVDAAWVAIDAQDRVYYVDNSDIQRVRRIPQTGGSATTFLTVSASEEITGITFDAARTTLYVVTRGSPSYVGTLFNYSTGRIYSVDLNGNAVLRQVLLQDPVQSGPYSDPGGIDVVGSVAYITAYRPDTDKVILAVDLTTGGTAVLFQYPLSDSIDIDVKLDSAGNIYSVRNVGATWSLYGNSSLVYNLKDIRTVHVDCLDRVWFTDGANNGAFDGGVYLLQGVNVATSIATGTNPQSVFGIDADSTGNIFIGSPDFGVLKIATQLRACEKDFTVSVTGAADKIVADYDPVQDIETPNSQFVVLTACLGEPTIPRSAANRVVWTYEDVDDPAADATIDTNGTSGNDNRGTFDGSDPFTAEPGYTLTSNRTSYDGSGCSKVRFHPTDAPGDNFTVTAVAETLIGTASVRSRVMTVWKRLHLELDSMGTVTGPLDPQGDDALIGDVPAPDPGLLVNAFKPAYIDVVLTETQHDTPAVLFDPHVPDSNQLSAEDQADQLLAQADYPGIRGSESVNGDWWVYLQGAYEGYVEQDKDPPTELAFVGATAGGVLAGFYGRASVVFLEVIRDAAADLDVDEAYLRRVYALHEIGHQFGLDDLPSPPNAMTVTDTQGQLLVAAPYFLPAQLVRLRCREGTDNCPPPSRDP